jgi:hypothetical protein
MAIKIVDNIFKSMKQNLRNLYWQGIATKPGLLCVSPMK